MARAEELIRKYSLERHPEGGWFAEVYTSLFAHDKRAFMGSIYFLLEGGDISHFHQIDCDEIWYYHEGSALKITLIVNGKVSEMIIGMGEGQTQRLHRPPYHKGKGDPLRFRKDRAEVGGGGRDNLQHHTRDGSRDNSRYRQLHLCCHHD